MSTSLPPTLEMEGQVVVTAAYALLMCCATKETLRRRNSCIWTREWILNSATQGAFHQLLQEFRVFDVSSYRNFVRMDVATFEELPCTVESDKLVDFFLTPPKRARCHYTVDRVRTLVTSR